MAQTLKNPPAMQETWVRSLGREDPLEEGMATWSSVLAWRIPIRSGAWWATKNQTRLSDFHSQGSRRASLVAQMVKNRPAI